MNYLILPSSRVFQIQQANKLVLIPNFYAEQILINPDNIAACFYIKNVSVYQLKQLAKPLFIHSYPKKIGCISYHSLQSNLSIIVSDKFGDIYQMNNEKPKFLNSNLGIPTFIHCYKKYLILGDQLNKIKIYNLENPHQIFSIWYIIDCSPLKLIQVSEGVFVLLAKYKQKDTLKQADRVYIFNEKQLLEVDFPGKAIYEGNSHSVSLSQQRTVTHILKLGQNKFSLLILQRKKLIVHIYEDNKLSKELQLQITPQKQPWQYLNAAYEQSSNCLYASFGIDADYQGEINVEQINFQPQKQEIEKKLNEIQTIAQISLI